MSSDELKDTVEGATKAVISVGIDKIKEWARKFLDKRLIFIQDEETINLVKNQLKSGEWSLCSRYLKNKDLKLFVQMGLALRQLDNDKNQKALLNLRTRILDKHGTKGLHISQFVQSKILSDFIGSVADKSNSVQDLIEKVEGLLLSLEKHVIFIQNKYNLDMQVDEILIRLKANVPAVFIIFASKSAINMGLNIKQKLEKQLKNYSIEIKQEKNRLLIFLFREEIEFYSE